MDIALKYLFLGLMTLLCAAMIHSISRALLGKQANGYPAGIVILAFTLSPWWVAALGGLAGHLLSVLAWNSLDGNKITKKRAANSNPEDA